MEINYISPVNSLGYGVAGWNILKHLGIMAEVAYFPIGTPEVENEADAEIIRHYIDNQQLFNPDAPSLRIWHQHDMAMHVGRGKRTGFPIFELDTFSHHEIHHLSQLDSIMVCSEWAKQVVLNHLPNMEVNVVPLGVDSSLFEATASQTWKDNRGCIGCEQGLRLEYGAHWDDNNVKMVCIRTGESRPDTIFMNVGKWEVRKGHDILVKAFNKAFSKSDNVQLWMMNKNPFLNDNQERQWIGLYKNSKLGDKVNIIDRVETHKELANLMGFADCGVFPSRGEGWNLELLEMMSCGKHVIATNYSAHTEFCNEHNCHLIEITSTEKAKDGIWFNGQGNWARIGDGQIDQLVSIMRSVHQKKQSGDVYNEDGRLTAEEFSWRSSAQKVLEGF